MWNHQVKKEYEISRKSGIKDPLTVLTLYEKHVKQALTSNEGKKWTLALKIGIFREYPTIIGDN